jgi:parvulin-like peptidyl-prolyl isomerase
MSRFALVALLLAAAAFAQTGRPKVNGKALTDAEFDAVLELAPPDIRSLAAKDPQQLLKFYGLIDRLSELADKASFTMPSPMKERLALQFKQALAQAFSDQYVAEHPVAPEEEQPYYEAHKADYTFARVKTLCVPIRNTSESAAAAAKAGKLARQIREGADFDALAAQYPVEGGFANVIGKSDPKIPEGIRGAVFALQPGAVTAPVALPNGVYLLKLQAIDVKPLAEVRGDVAARLSTERFYAWLDSVRQSVTIEPPSL